MTWPRGVYFEFGRSVDCPQVDSYETYTKHTHMHVC